MEYSKMTTEQMAEELCEVIRDGAASTSTVMHIIDEWKKDLQHHKDTTIGLWATDRPDLIVDEKKIMFQISDPHTPSQPQDKGEDETPFRASYIDKWLIAVSKDKPVGERYSFDEVANLIFEYVQHFETPKQ